MSTNINWKKFGNGYLAIDHRPKISRIKDLKSNGAGEHRLAWADQYFN